MAQNPYNNYIKRQQQKPMNNFKEKVKNSLGGVQTNNIVNTPSANPTTPSVSHSKPIQPYSNTNTPKPTQTPVTAQPLANANTSTQPITTPPVNAPAPQPNAPIEGGTGLIGLSDVNNAFTPQATPQATPQDVPPIVQPITEGEVNELANNPEIQRQAYASGKTPQQMAQELLAEQKKQLQADWEFKQQQFQEQQKQAQAQFDQSKVDSENAYNESIDAINQDRYNRQQDLNVSGSKRGIQYSPQQLGLETVANINTNKNVTEAGKQRNELLNKLTQQLNQINADILMSSQASINDYNNSLAKLNSDYMNKIMDWEWNQQQTDAERAWQEKQAEADRAFQEKMQNAQNAWQSKENDKNKSRGYSGGGGGGYSYGGGSGWKNYGGYSRSSYGSMGGDWDESSAGSDYLSQESNSLAYEKAFKDVSNQVMDEASNNMPLNYKARSDYYTGEMEEALNYAKQNGMGAEGYRNLTKDYDHKQNTLYEKYGSNKKDGVLKDGNNRFEHALKTNKTPTAMGRSQANMLLETNKRLSSRPIEDKAPTKPKKSSSKNVNNAVAKKMASKAMETTSKATKKTVEKVSKSVAKSKENNKKAKENSKKNSKTSVNKAKQNSKKAKENSKKNSKKATSNASKNLKKSVNKMKEKVKNTFKKKKKK